MSVENGKKFGYKPSIAKMGMGIGICPSCFIPIPDSFYQYLHRTTPYKIHTYLLRALVC